MARYRKRPVVISAVQLDPWNAHRYVLPDGVEGVPSYSADNWSYDGCRFFIQTLEGRMEAKPGDWIITGVAGEVYACRDEIFRATYEPVEGEEN